MEHSGIVLLEVNTFLQQGRHLDDHAVFDALLCYVMQLKNHS